MFGYVTVYNQELKMKDYYKYKAYYCGLCKTLKERHGRFGQMTLTYDMTFLIILLTSLYETEIVREKHRCLVHPLKQHDMIWNEITEYAADMNIALSYHHFLDDWKDEKSMAGFAGAAVLKKDYQRICKRYERQCRVIEESLQQLQQCEQDEEDSLDKVSWHFGKLMEELLVYKQDVWEESLRKIGFYLGKYIYLIDAYDDLEKDIKKDNYNPLKAVYNKESYEMDCKNMLNMMLAECSAEFEKLPCVLDIDILRNILYAGVWIKFDSIQNKRETGKGQNNDNGSI